MQLAARFFQCFKLPTPDELAIIRAKQPAPVVVRKPYVMHSARTNRFVAGPYAQRIAAAAEAAATPVVVVAETAPVAVEPVVVVTQPAAPAAVEAIAAEPVLDAAWTNNTMAVRLFTLAGKAKFRLTGTDGVSFEYQVKKASEKHARADRKYFVDCPALDVSCGTLNRLEEFIASTGRSRIHPATKLFAKWWAEAGMDHPSDVAIQHLGACGKCGRPLEDAVSVACGIGPQCHLQVFGVSRATGKPVTPRVRKPKLVAEVVAEPVAYVDPVAHLEVSDDADALYWSLMTIAEAAELGKSDHGERQALIQNPPSIEATQQVIAVLSVRAITDRNPQGTPNSLVVKSLKLAHRILSLLEEHVAA